MRYNLSSSMADRVNFDEAVYRTISEFDKDMVDFLQNGCEPGDAVLHIIDAVGVAVDDVEEGFARVQDIARKTLNLA